MKNRIIFLKTLFTGCCTLLANQFGIIGPAMLLITNPHFKWGFEKRPQGLCYCSPERRVAQAYFTCCR